MKPAISTAALTSTLWLMCALGPAAHADGVCTQRAPTAAEKTAYANSYALFLRVAPKAPDGWASVDHPRTGAMPQLCRESGNEPIRRSFQRNFQLERGRQAREDEAVQAYAASMKNQQAKAEANKAAGEAIDAQIAVLIDKSQKAAAAKKYEEIDAINRQMDALTKKKTALMGYDDVSAESANIAAAASRDTEAAFSLWFELPKNESPSGQPYRTAAGKAFVTSYDDGGNPKHDVRIFFNGAPQQARVSISGDPARVRSLVDSIDLKSIATYK